MNALHLSNELMGLGCLAAFWICVLLVGADVWSEMRDLLRLRRSLAGVRKGEVVSTDGEGGALATFAFEQRGHALDGETPAVDVSHGLAQHALYGGLVRVDGEEEHLDADEDGLVWLSEDAFEVGAEHPEDFEACVKRATSPRGYRRPITLEVKAGDSIWFAPGFVSTIDPHLHIVKHFRKWTLYGVTHLCTAVLCTAIAVAAPMESWVAMFGGALCLGHFLGSPPVLRAVRAATRTPEETRRFWIWRAT